MNTLTKHSKYAWNKLSIHNRRLLCQFVEHIVPSLDFTKKFQLSQSAATPDKTLKIDTYTILEG